MTTRMVHAVAVGAFLSWVLLVSTAGAGGPPPVSGKFHSQRGLPGLKHDDAKKFERFWIVDPNTGKPLGPSYADILVTAENSVPCRGGPRLEEEVGCSWCANQICGCEANAQTNAEIHQLNQEQLARGILPQCEQNGTLCGSP